MLTLRKQPMAIYVDRSSHQWIVRDPEGNFWILPDTDNPWIDRQSFDLTGSAELEPVPGHYRTMLCIPYQ